MSAQRAPDLDALADALTSPEWEGTSGAECPEPARLWEAACGRLTPRGLAEVADHAARCPGCARELAAARRAADQIGELAPLPAAPSTFRELVEKISDVVSRRLATAAVLAAAAAAVAFLLLLPPSAVPPSALSRPREDVGAGIVRLLVPDGQALPRDDFVLRWQGPEGARYDVRVMTADLDEVAVVTDLTASELRLGEEELAGLAAGTTLLWQVEAYLPNGERFPSPAFRARLE